MSRPGWLWSLQTRLIAASAVTVVLAVLLTGAVFVYRDREAQRTEQLNQIASATRVFSLSTVPFGTIEITPSTVDTGTVLNVGGAVSTGTIEGVTISRALAPDYRILLVDRGGHVVSDPAGQLAGARVDLPLADVSDLKRGYVTWSDGTPQGQNVTFLAPTAFDYTAPDGLTAVAAIETSSLTADWLATAPDLALSALIGLPAAVLAVVFVTRRVTNPLRRLTLAADGMARGDFDQRVDVRGRDEVAVLASSFTVMAGRVKQRDTQLRDLIANVSHDLRTPLTSIQGYAEALADGVAPPGGVGRMAGIIRDEARHASSLLANLLSLSEIEAGEVVVLAEPCDLVPVIERCIRRLDLSAAERGIAVRADIEDALWVAGDEEKTERALANVFENAVRFTATSVTVRARLEGDAVILQVENDGPPIEPEHADRIFDRFYRTPGPGGGTGLGLAIAREMLVLQGGSLTLESPSPVVFRAAWPVLSRL